MVMSSVLVKAPGTEGQMTDATRCAAGSAGLPGGRSRHSKLSLRGSDQRNQCVGDSVC